MVVESKLLRDVRTGEKREVDIVIETESAGYSVLIGLECTAAARKASVEWVERMWGKHADLPTDKLILVSRTGFWSTAAAKADALGIVTLSLEEAKTADWPRIVGKLAAIYVEFVESKLKVSAAVIGDGGSEEIVSIGEDVELLSADDSVSLKVGTLARRLAALPEVGRVIMETMHNQDQERATFSANYKFPEPVFARDTVGVRREIRSLWIELEATRNQAKMPLRHGNLRGVAVAYGEGVAPQGKLRISVVEREGQPPAIRLLKQTESSWKPLVFVDETGPGAGELKSHEEK